MPPWTLLFLIRRPRSKSLGNTNNSGAQTEVDHLGLKLLEDTDKTAAPTIHLTWVDKSLILLFRLYSRGVGWTQVAFFNQLFSPLLNACRALVAEVLIQTYFSTSVRRVRACYIDERVFIIVRRSHLFDFNLSYFRWSVAIIYPGKFLISLLRHVEVSTLIYYVCMRLFRSARCNLLRFKILRNVWYRYQITDNMGF